jgi:hypothetical protein
MSQPWAPWCGHLPFPRAWRLPLQGREFLHGSPNSRCGSEDHRDGVGTGSSEWTDHRDGVTGQIPSARTPPSRKSRKERPQLWGDGPGRPGGHRICPHFLCRREVTGSRGAALMGSVSLSIKTPGSSLSPTMEDTAGRSHVCTRSRLSPTWRPPHLDLGLQPPGLDLGRQDLTLGSRT